MWHASYLVLCPLLIGPFVYRYRLGGYTVAKVGLNRRLALGIQQSYKYIRIIESMDATYLITLP